MKSIAIMVFMFLTFTVGTNAQENREAFTAEEQEIVDLSKCKWDWMSEKNVEKLAELFHENSQFVHMGGYWGKQQELGTIRTGGIWYKKAEIQRYPGEICGRNGNSLQPDTFEFGGWRQCRAVSFYRY